MADDGAGSADRRWPALEQQLRESEVTPGSALEQLIKENQDFSMLRPEEANDNLRLPLWLRVYWRKQHPEIEHRPGDPTGGYPLALRDAHLWMLRNQDLPAAKGSEPDPGGERGS